MAEQKITQNLLTNLDQNKTKIKKSWCDHHKYNVSHETKNCHFLNNKKNKKTKEIKQAEATDDCSDDEFHSADDSTETEGTQLN